MKKSPNQNVADFEHDGKKYEIDLLLDSIANGFASYDIFCGEICVGCMCLEYDEDIMGSELIELAKEELNLINEED